MISYGLEQFSIPQNFDQNIFTLRPAHGPWKVFSWEKINKLNESISFPCLEPGKLQSAYRTDWKRLARYLKGGKITAANLEHNSYYYNI